MAERKEKKEQESRMYKREQVVLELYIDYILNGLGLEDKLLKMAFMYVLNEHCGFKNTLMSALFGRLGKYTTDEKSMFLRNVQSVSKRIIDDMAGISLSFNDTSTSFINELLVLDRLEDIVNELDYVSTFVEDMYLKKEILLLKEKL